MNEILESIRPRGDHLIEERSEEMLRTVMLAPRDRRRRPVRRTVLVATGSIVLAGIGAFSVGQLVTGGGSETADCIPRVRLDSRVFVQSGFAEHVEATPLATGERSACEDIGDNHRGWYFPENPDTVDVWSLHGFDPALVVGIKQSGGFLVLVSASAPSGYADGVLEKLSQGQTGG